MDDSKDVTQAIVHADGERSDNAFLAQLGQRVRRGRAIRGMSRKILARDADISERYIAQLEGGAGNVSVILLRRVAAAIGSRLEDLVVDGAGEPADWPAIRALLREATPQQIDQVKSLLKGGALHHTAAEADRVALIGLRGAGKSSLGAAAALELHWPFFELNGEIERESGFTVAEIFSIYGQEGYRRFERRSLQRILERPGPMILATGGGIVADNATFELLLSSFFTIWVQALPAEHMARVRGQGDLRPLARNRAAMEDLVTILTSREPLYARASANLNTSGASLEESVDALVKLIGDHCSIATAKSALAAHGETRI